MQGAAQFSRALFGRDLIQAARASVNLLDEVSVADVANTDDGRRLKALADRLAAVAQLLWSPTPSHDIFGPECVLSLS